MTYKGFTEAIPEIEKILGYTFRDKSLLLQAFTRSSWCNENGSGIYQSNEVLEFFGDSVLSAVIVSFLLSERTERYRYGIRTELGEGDFSNIKSKLSDKTNLSRSTGKLGLERYLLMGEGDLKLGIAEEPSVMEDLFESIVGAVYIDTGKDIDAVTAVVSRILDMSVYADSSAPSVSPKNALQEWCADKRRRLPSPVYKTLGESGPDHKKIYLRGVYIGDRLVAKAEGKNQKTADTLAAKEALTILREEESAQSRAEGREKSPARAEAPRGPSNSNAPKPAKPKAEKPATATVKATKPESPASKKSESPASKKSESPASKKPESPASKKSESPAGKKSAKVGALTLLKRHAQKSSAASPVFRDLGVFTLGESVEYHIECSFMGKRVIASGDTRLEARENAALLIAKELKIQ